MQSLLRSMSKRNWVAEALALALLGALAGCAKKQPGETTPLKAKEVTGMSDDAQMNDSAEDFLHGEQKIYKHVREIPEACKQAFSGADLNTQMFIADPGKEFNETDVIDESKPRQRLVFAGSGVKSCFVYYEQGGR